jgi:hypothetical protein
MRAALASGSPLNPEKISHTFSICPGASDRGGSRSVLTDDGISPRPAAVHSRVTTRPPAPLSERRNCAGSSTRAAPVWFCTWTRRTMAESASPSTSALHSRSSVAPAALTITPMGGPLFCASGRRSA